MSNIVERLRELEAKFWRHVVPGNPEECWNWRGPRFSSGYGRIDLSRKTGTTASRVAMLLKVGHIDPEIEVCHTCDNRQCVNPNHLFLGTAKDNAQDKAAKGRCNTPIGEKNGSAKLSPADILAIRASVSSHAQMAREYAVNESLIRQIRSGSIWKHV